MAFRTRNLSVLAYASGFTLWHYKTLDDVLEDVASDNYMADAADMIAAGDMVLITARNGGAIRIVTASLTDSVHPVVHTARLS